MTNAPNDLLGGGGRALPPGLVLPAGKRSGLDIRGVKARPHDLNAMLGLGPSLVELHCSAKDLEWTPPQPRYGLPMALHVPEYLDGYLLDPASCDEARRKAAEAVYVKAAETAVRWAPKFEGVPKIVLHPGGSTPGEADYDSGRREQRLDSLGRTIEAMKAAAGDKAEVLLENLPRSCWFFGGAWKANVVVGGGELADLGKMYACGVTLDLCHLYLACNEMGLDFLHEIEEAVRGGRVRHVHYSDAAGTDCEGLQVGEGTLPLGEAFKRLSGQIAPDVACVPEIWFGHENDGAAFVEAWRRVAALTSSCR